MAAPDPYATPLRGERAHAGPEQRRGRRGAWADARFVLGIVLIAASVAGVWGVIAAARQTAPVLVAARTIVPGERISRADLTVADVALGRLGSDYLPGDADVDGVVASRTISAGELVPRAGVQPAAKAATTTVVVRSPTDVPAEVRAGSPVEVWSAAKKEGGGYAEPRILVARATVAAVSRDDSLLGGGAAALELVIPRADVPDALEAITGEAAISVVPTGVGE